MKVKMFVGAACAVILLFAIASQAMQTNVQEVRELSPAEKRGKALYLRGESASGKEIKAIVGDLDVPASTMTCGG
ncbi:MAG TPA: hypothetical protein VGP59_01445, partial [Pyrinomonadaceae bacterium]|nr:hypothetical protein [Pyrinomonadaceae bacterium]